MLVRLGLPRFDDKTLEEIRYHMVSYNELLENNDGRINKDARKKMILTSTFEILSGLFDLDFDKRLKFSKSDNSGVCIEDFNSFNSSTFSLSLDKITNSKWSHK